MLPFEEWPRLEGTEAEHLWPLLRADRAQVVVVERGGEILGCHVLMWVLHAECLWIHPAHRGRGAVGRRLWPMVKRLARAAGVQVLATAAQTDEVRRLLEHVKARKLEADHYVIDLGV